MGGKKPRKEVVDRTIIGGDLVGNEKKLQTRHRVRRISLLLYICHRKCRRGNEKESFPWVEPIPKRRKREVDNSY